MLVEYSPAHLADLGWSPEEQESNEGKILWIKPAVLDEDLTADVQQYRLQHLDFP